MKRLIVFVTLFFIAFFTFGESGIQELYSPMFIARGTNSAGTYSPASDTLNPAASGGRQNPAIDFSYLSLAGFGGLDQFGHAINIGVSIPSRIGVFTGSGRLISSPFTGIYQDTLGGVNFSFAKDLYRNLLFGLGLGFQIGSTWGLGLDTGFIHMPGSLLASDSPFLQDFKWGFVIRNMGKGYKPAGSDLAWPPAFTPAFGASLTLLKTRPVSVTFMPDISFPGFRNIRIQAGASISVFDMIHVNGAYVFDLKEYKEGTGRPMPFSFGIAATFNPIKKPDIPGTTGVSSSSDGDDSGRGQEGMSVHVSSANLGENVWAIGLGSTITLGFYDRTPPVIETGERLTDISPNYDGIQDELVIPLTITDERYLMGYRLVINNDTGTTVRTIKNKEDRPENEGFRNIIDRFTAKKEGIPVPETLRWDGKNDSGAVAPDGDYTYYIEAWDDNGNIGKTEAFTVSIDTVYPELDLTSPYTVFSPNGDGRQDTLILKQDGSEEVLWTGWIEDPDGKEIRTFTWDNTKPPDHFWDGRNSKGILPPDGVYRYVMSATDKAGNTTSSAIENIIINTTPTPVTLFVEYSEFSPNGDGVQDVLPYTLKVPVTEGVTRWNIEITREDGTVVKTLSGGVPVPDSVTFDGTDNDGKQLREGTYQSRLSVLYVNGNLPQADAPPVFLDVTPPKAEATPVYPAFSPNGDGRKDTMAITQQTSWENLWTGTVTGPEGNIINSVTWQGTADEYIEWDGRNRDGNLVPDGSYGYILSSTDGAGNPGASPPVTIILDTLETPVKLTADRDYFSPNGDGIRDSVSLVPELNIRDSVESWQIVIQNGNGQTVTSFNGNAAVPGEVVWDGTTSGGGKAPDGRYQGILTVVYIQGNTPEARTGTLTIDAEYPRASVSVEEVIFSPDGDGRQDTLTIKQQTSEEDLWQGSILDNRGTAVRTLFWKGRASDVTWDGKDDNGNSVPDGSYSYMLTSQDKAGNKAEAKTGNFRVDTKPTPVSLSVASRAFSPNGDDVKDTLIFRTGIQENTGIRSWELEVADTRGTVLRTITGTGSVPEEIVFDGKNSRGVLIKEGSYTGTLSVVYEKGANPEAVSPEFWLDLTPPAARASADNRVFSPNGDGKKDTVVFSLTGSEEEEWAGTITDDSGKTINTTIWKGTPESRYTWNGRDLEGKLVPDGRYLFLLSSTDTAGNTGISSRVAVVKDTRDTPLTLKTEPQYISPNGDGKNDTLDILLLAGRRDSVESYELSIKTKSGETVWTMTGSGSLPESVTWDGRDNQGNPAPDGEYTGAAGVVYANGNAPAVHTGSFFIDTTPPSIDITYDALLFSPDGDGRLDTVVLRQKSSTETIWEGRIEDQKGNTVKNMLWKGVAEDYSWDGKDDNGNHVPDGTYVYFVESADSAGNSVEKQVPGIRIDTRETPVFLTASLKQFSPNNDGSKDTIDLRSHVSLTEGIDSWTLSLIHSSEGIQKSFKGTSVPPETFTWDGMGDAGSAENGPYTAELTVSYTKGNRPVARVGFTLDTSPPVITLGVSPAPFSPDNDGVDDELNINIGVDDDSKIKQWRIDITDPAGNIFTSYSGKGEPARRIIWEGLSDTGELVQSAEDYRLIMTVEDELGNIGTYETLIPVDVLVIREGNRLKVIISSIVFAPNTADFSNVDDEKALRNNKTLKRLAEIFNKYSSYRITIEGHAVMINWNDPVKAKVEQEEELLPLSKARAEAVKNALVELGIDKNRITTEGRGGEAPIVPHGDVTNRWKNRRVEFILVK